MPRFAIVSTRPYQDRAIINLDNISIITTKTEPDGTKSVQLQMVDGSRLAITASFAEIQQALGANALQVVAESGRGVQAKGDPSDSAEPADQAVSNRSAV
jgi:SRSO17 transposase